MTNNELILAFWLSALLLSVTAVVSIVYAVQQSLYQYEWYQRRKGGYWVYDVFNEWRPVDKSTFYAIVCNQGRNDNFHRDFSK